MKRALLAFALIGGLLVTAALFRPGPVNIKVTPSTGFVPLHISDIVSIDKDARNREACIVLAGVEFARQSCKGLDGADEPVTTQIAYTIPIAGTYRISVVLYRNDGTVIQSNIETVDVIGTGGDNPHELDPTGPSYSVRDAR